MNAQSPKPRNCRPSNLTHPELASSDMPRTGYHVQSSVADELKDRLPFRRRSSCSFVSYPSLEDISCSEPDFDVDEVFQRASFVRRASNDYLLNEAEGVVDGQFSDPTFPSKQAIVGEQDILDKLYELRHYEPRSLCISAASQTKEIDDICMHQAHQSATETTYERSSVFSESLSPVYDQQQAISSTAMAVSSLCEELRPRHLTCSAFERYSPPLIGGDLSAPSSKDYSRIAVSRSLASLSEEPATSRRQLNASSSARSYPRMETFNQQPHRSSRDLSHESGRRPQLSGFSHRELNHEPCNHNAMPRQEAQQSAPVQRIATLLPSNSRSPRIPVDSTRTNSNTLAGVEIEITPGQSMPLRRSHETIDAAGSGYAAQLACMACETFLATVPNCQLVICPICRFLSPVEDGDCYLEGQYVRSMSSDRWGIGLGLVI